MTPKTILIVGLIVAAGLLVIRRAKALPPGSFVYTITPGETPDSYNYTVAPGGQAAFTGAASGDVFHPSGIFGVFK